jgi:alpha-amylase
MGFLGMGFTLGIECHRAGRMLYVRSRFLLPLIGALALSIQSARSAAQPAASPQNNLVYEIFVRSFADGDKDPKGIGDLRGIISQFDRHLNDGDPKTDSDLEVGVIWLMPIFPSPTYHGYDVTDYRAINAEYGTMADFKALIGAAHKRGVRVILDAPFNHTSDQHPWFREAIDNPASPRRQFYNVEPDTGPRGDNRHSIVSKSGERLRYLGVFSARMPDLNFDNAEVRREIEAIAKFWLDLGVDGFRLDAAKHVYGERLDRLSEEDILRNNEWWREFSHAVYRTSPNAVLIGEVLGDPEMLRRHAWGLDGLTDEPFMNDLRAEIARPGPGFTGRRRQFIEQARALNRTAYEPPLPFPDQPFEPYPYAASHDRNPRLASDLEEMKRRGMRYSVDEAYRLAMYTLLSMSSRPILYQGDEVMQRGWKWNGSRRTNPDNPGDGSGIFDETLREPFPWFASGQGPGQTRWFQPRFDSPNDGVSREEQAEPGGMLQLVRALTNLRTRHPAFANGEIGAIPSDSDDWLVFERGTGSDQYLVLINRSTTGKDYRFHRAWFPQYRGADLAFWSDGHARRWKDVTADGERIGDSVFVPPAGFVLIKQRRP